MQPEHPRAHPATHAHARLLGPACRAAFGESVAQLSPASFAVVMATGIVSIAAGMQDMPVVAAVRFWLNNAVYAVLVFLNALRALRDPRRFFGDMTEHLRGPGFFTFVAGSCILGTQYVVLLGSYRAALLLWALAIVAWVVLTYAIFTAFTIKEAKPVREEGISGAWLLAVVATLSIAALGAYLAAHWAQPYRIEANFFVLSMWLWGGMLYIWMISLIFYRDTLFRLSPVDLGPPYWINMGAMAISTLTGSLLIMNSSDAAYLSSLLPFVKGFTVFYWATGTCWIPMLLVLRFWRHVHKRFPLRYDPLYWGAVFPLGMYPACTRQMARAMDLPFLLPIPRYFVFVTLAAWTAAFVGMLHALAQDLLGPVRGRASDSAARGSARKATLRRSARRGLERAPARAAPDWRRACALAQGGAVALDPKSRDVVAVARAGAGLELRQGELSALAQPQPGEAQ